MRCSNPDCLLDARLFPRRKISPVKDQVDAAAAEVGVTREQAATYESVRARVLATAKHRAYVEHSELAVCGEADCISWASSQIEGEGAVQLVPIRKVRER